MKNKISRFQAQTSDQGKKIKKMVDDIVGLFKIGEVERRDTDKTSCIIDLRPMEDFEDFPTCLLIHKGDQSTSKI